MKLLSIVAACAAVFAGAPAWAAASAQVTLSGFTVTLYDLNPADGIDSSISFGSTGYATYLSTSALDPEVGSQSGSSWSFTPFGNRNSASVAGGTYGSASLTGQLATGLTMSAGGLATGWSTLPDDYYSGTSFEANASASNAWDGLTFTLSANTLAVFSGAATATATTTIGYQELGCCGSTEEATASISLGVSGLGPGGVAGTQSSGDGFSAGASWEAYYDENTGQWRYSGQNRTTSRTLVASFTNMSGGALEGQLTLNLEARGYSSVSAVPEPGAMAMLLAGLGVIGLRFRRRVA